MYLYICGSVGGRWALDVSRAASWEAMSAYVRRGTQPKSLFVLPLIGLLLRILESEYERMCDLCVSAGHRAPHCGSASSSRSLGYPNLRWYPASSKSHAFKIRMDGQIGAALVRVPAR